MNLWRQVRTLRGLFMVSRTCGDPPCVDSKRFPCVDSNVPVYAGNTREADKSLSHFLLTVEVSILLEVDARPGQA